MCGCERQGRAFALNVLFRFLRAVVVLLSRACVPHEVLKHKEDECLFPPTPHLSSSAGNHSNVGGVFFHFMSFSETGLFCHRFL